MLDHYVGMQAPERKLSMCTMYGLEHGLCRGKTNGQEQKLKGCVMCALDHKMQDQSRQEMRFFVPPIKLLVNQCSIL